MTLRPWPSTALDVLLVTVTATAPATLTLEPDELSPLEVLALALLVSPVLLARFAGLVLPTTFGFGIVELPEGVRVITRLTAPVDGYTSDASSNAVD